MAQTANDMEVEEWTTMELTLSKTFNKNAIKTLNINYAVVEFVKATGEAKDPKVKATKLLFRDKTEMKPDNIPTEGKDFQEKVKLEEHIHEKNAAMVTVTLNITARTMATFEDIRGATLPTLQKIRMYLTENIFGNDSVRPELCGILTQINPMAMSPKVVQQQLEAFARDQGIVPKGKEKFLSVEFKPEMKTVDKQTTSYVLTVSCRRGEKSETIEIMNQISLKCSEMEKINLGEFTSIHKKYDDAEHFRTVLRHQNRWVKNQTVILVKDLPLRALMMIPPGENRNLHQIATEGKRFQRVDKAIGQHRSGNVIAFQCTANTEKEKREWIQKEAFDFVAMHRVALNMSGMPAPKIVDRNNQARQTEVTASEKAQTAKMQAKIAAIGDMGMSLDQPIRRKQGRTYAAATSTASSLSFSQSTSAVVGHHNKPPPKGITAAAEGLGNIWGKRLDSVMEELKKVSTQTEQLAKQQEDSRKQQEESTKQQQIFQRSMQEDMQKLGDRVTDLKDETTLKNQQLEDKFEQARAEDRTAIQANFKEIVTDALLQASNESKRAIQEGLSNQQELINKQLDENTKAIQAGLDARINEKFAAMDLQPITPSPSKKRAAEAAGGVTYQPQANPNVRTRMEEGDSPENSNHG